MLHSQLMAPLVALGRWDEAVRVGDAVLAGQSDIDAMSVATFVAPIAAARGDEAMLERCRVLGADQRESTHVDQRVSATLTLARDAVERGATDDALRLARAVLDEHTTAGEYVAEAYALGIEAAIALGDEAAIAELEAFVAALPPARATPLLRAGRARLAAEQAQRSGDAEAVERHEAEAIALLRSVGARPLLARALLGRARGTTTPMRWPRPARSTPTWAPPAGSAASKRRAASAATPSTSFAATRTASSASSPASTSNGACRLGSRARWRRPCRPAAR